MYKGRHSKTKWGTLTANVERKQSNYKKYIGAHELVIRNLRALR